VDKNNDFANMAEAVTRRFKRGLLERAAIVDGRVKELDEGLLVAEPQGDYAAAGFSPEEDEPSPETAQIEELPEVPGPGEGAKFAVFPDLLIIDGGKGQLSYARTAMRSLGVEHLPTFGLAKEEELLCEEGRDEWIRLPRGSQGLFLLQRVRDEAHRFAITYHRKLHGKAATHSRLDDVPGIGPKRKKALLKAFGSIKRIREASFDEVLAVPGMTRDAAERVLEHLGGSLRD
jgi:excinuclease UvrABC nuclease subunit